MKRLARMDAVSAGLLLIWAGAGLAFALAFVPGTFQVLQNPELATRLVGYLVRRLDMAAYAAFGVPLLLVYGVRWMEDFKEEGIGPLRLWSAAALAGLLMTFTSAAIVSPRIEELRVAHSGTAIASLPADHPDHRAFNKAHGLSRQLFGLRLLLALGLAAGLAFVPKASSEKPSEALRGLRRRLRLQDGWR